MLRCAEGVLLLGLTGLMEFAGGGCTPGPIRARAADVQADAVGGTGGSVVEVEVGGPDGAAPVPDAAPVVDARPADLGEGGGPGGAAGAGAAQVMDGGGPLDARDRDAPAAELMDAAADGARARDAAVDAPHLRPPQPGEVVVDELLANPAGDDLGREWIEIVSRAAEPLDLSGLHLATASTDVAAPAGAVAPGALLLLGQSRDSAKNGGAPVAIAYGTKLILVNGSGQLSLCIGPCASGMVIDALSWEALPDAYTGHALVVDPEMKTYCPATVPFGTGGNFGTPGAVNPRCTEIIDAAAPADGAADGADDGAADAGVRD